MYVRVAADESPEHPPTAESTAQQIALNRRHGVPLRLVADGFGEGKPKERLSAALTTHFQLVWRTLRRFGVAAAGIDDAAQHVFLTLASRLDELAPGAERGFLIGACAGVAANARRRARRSLESADPIDEALAEDLSPEELLEWKRRRELLDRALDALSLEHRTVFVLHELEQFSLPEIAASLGIPLGTATSRLRRARLRFEAWVEEHQRTGGHG